MSPNLMHDNVMCAIHLLRNVHEIFKKYNHENAKFVISSNFTYLPQKLHVICSSDWSGHARPISGHLC